MLKSIGLFFVVCAVLVCSSRAQVLTGRPGNPVAKTFSVSAQILEEGSFQLQSSGAGLTNWSTNATFNALAGTNGFSDTITHAQRFYRVVQLTNAPVITGQPTGTTNFHNEQVRLEVAASGSWPLRYYWFRGGEVVQVTSSNVYSFAGRAALSGNYTVGVSNTWGIQLSSAAAVKTVNPVATSISGKKIQYVIKGAQGNAFPNVGSFETTYGQLAYNTVHSNPFLNDQGQWQYGTLNETVGRALWLPGGFIYPNGAWLDMTFTNLTGGTYTLQVPNVNAHQFGEFKITN